MTVDSVEVDNYFAVSIEHCPGKEVRSKREEKIDRSVTRTHHLRISGLSYGARRKQAVGGCHI